MKEETVERLKAACLQIWRDLDNPASNMSFGIQCGDGWSELLFNFSLTIAIELMNFPEPAFKIIEVKEKNGKLVIRHEGSENDDIYQIVDVFCEEASTICEICGGKNSVKVRNFGEAVKTLCIAHA